VSQAKAGPRVIVITGGSSGIGRASAHLLARRGEHLVLAARGRDRLDAAVQECLALGAASATARVVDVADRSLVDALLSDVVTDLGRVDGVIHSAGVAAYGRFTDIEPEVVEGVQTTNYLGTANVARAALRQFEHQEQGTLVLVGSLLGKIATPYMSPYIASKWAVHGLARVLQIEVRRSPHIAVALVTPGGVDTPIYRWAASSLGRQGQPPPPVDPPEKVAKAAVAALDHPRRDISVGLSNHISVAGFRLFPWLFDLMVTPLMETFGLDPLPVDDHPGNVGSSQPDASAEPYGQHDSRPVRLVRRGLNWTAAFVSTTRKLDPTSAGHSPSPGQQVRTDRHRTGRDRIDAAPQPADPTVLVERRVEAGPEQVWDVLGDGWAYASWVVGASRTRDVDGAWPALGSRIHHSFGIWPAVIDDTTEVLLSQPGDELRLRARGRPMGEAHVVITLKSALGGSTVVGIREDVASGPAALIPRPLRQLAISRRNREALRRLAYLAERSSGQRKNHA
jgi:short-subunit dehydrogenase